MREILEELVKTAETEIRQAYLDLKICSVETEGSYLIKIDRLKKYLSKVSLDLELFNSANSPNELFIYCFIVSSNLQEIRDNLGESLYKYIDNKRYDEKLLEKWKPFDNENTIEDMLNEFKELKGYNFTTQFLNGGLSNDTVALIDNVKSTSFAIIDLLSINHLNALLVQRFDTKDVGGIIFPYCRSLDIELQSNMDATRKMFFKVAEYHSTLTTYSSYIFEVTKKHNFFQQLSNIFFNNFKIKNQIRIESTVRGLNVDLL